MSNNTERSRSARVRVTHGWIEEDKYLEQRRREAVNILASDCADIEFLHPSCDEDGPCISRTLLDRDEARTLLQETANAIPVRHMLSVTMEACEVRANAEATLKIERGERPIVAEGATLALAMLVRDARDRGDIDMTEKWAVFLAAAIALAEEDRISRIAHLEQEGLPPPGFGRKK
jgi:hypothetical protein